MQLTAVFKALRYILLVSLCLALLLAAPCSCNLLCFSGTQNRGLLKHPVRKHLNENDPSAATVAAATMAQLSPVVFRGTLLSVLVQRDGTVRATFSVDQSMKKELGEGHALSLDAGQLEVVYLQRSAMGDPCVFDVNEENLKLGSSYVVFGRSSEGATSSVFATAFPVPYEKRTFRAIKKIVCKGCAKPPRVEGLKNVRIVERGKLRLQCHVSGNPIPWVTWYKDGLPIDGSGRVRVRTKKRTSRLTIRQSRLKDRGVYECRATNIVQETPASAKATVTVTRRTTKKPQQPLPTTSTTASSLWPVESCPNSNFCLNGGTCFFYKDVREYVCHCADGFVGHRCDFKDVRASLGHVKILEEAHNRLFVAVVILFIILFCLNWGCLAACWLCCFRRKGYSWKNVRKMATLYAKDSRWAEIVPLKKTEKELDLGSKGEAEEERGTTEDQERQSSFGGGRCSPEELDVRPKPSEGGHVTKQEEDDNSNQLQPGALVTKAE